MGLLCCNASTTDALAELVLNLVALFDVSVDELVGKFLSLRRVLANEDGLHAEFVEALQVVKARSPLLLLLRLTVFAQELMSSLSVVVWNLGCCGLLRAWVYLRGRLDLRASVDRRATQGSDVWMVQSAAFARSRAAIRLIATSWLCTSFDKAFLLSHRLCLLIPHLLLLV